MSNNLLDYPLYNNGKDLNRNHITSLDNTVQAMLDDYTRVFALRVDLHIPDNDYIGRHRLMTRFIGSLKAQLKSSECKRKRRNPDIRIYPNTVRYVWAKEYGTKNKLEHYHVLLLFNKDAYHRLGNYRTEGSLANRINKAWVRALGQSVDYDEGLVHFAKNGCYYIDGNAADYESELDDLMCRASYLCKHETKVISANRRSFGASPRVVRKRAFS